MVGPKRTMGATFFPPWPEHEVIDDELALAGEQIAECCLAARPVENIFLFDFDPGQLATFQVQCVAQFRKLLFPGEMFLAGGEPFLLGNHFAVFDPAGSFDFWHNILLWVSWDTFQTSAARDSFDPTGARPMSTRPF